MILAPGLGPGSHATGEPGLRSRPRQTLPPSWGRRKPSLDREKMTANKNHFARSWFYRNLKRNVLVLNEDSGSLIKEGFHTIQFFQCTQSVWCASDIRWCDDKWSGPGGGPWCRHLIIVTRGNQIRMQDTRLLTLSIITTWQKWTYLLLHASRLFIIMASVEVQRETSEKVARICVLVLKFT